MSKKDLRIQFFVQYVEQFLFLDFISSEVNEEWDRLYRKLEIEEKELLDKLITEAMDFVMEKLAECPQVKVIL